MRYEIRARDYWDDDLRARFGEMSSIHILTDADVVAAIITYGRAAIKNAKPAAAASNATATIIFDDVLTFVSVDVFWSIIFNKY